MANRELNTLKLGIGDTVKDLIVDFDFVCTQGPSFTAIGKTKELASNTWLDEDGNDVYIPKQMMIDAGTLKVPIGITGDRGTCQGKLKTLVKWLLGRGGDELDTDGIKLYSAFIAEGYRKATLSEVSEPEYGYLGDSEILETTLTFNIPNPFDNVTFDGKNFVQQ